MNRNKWVVGFGALALGFAGCQSGGETIQLVGTVERQSLEIAAPISEVIVEIPVGIGDRVTADQVVVRLDSAVAEAELAASEAALAAAEAQQAQAQREFARIEGLQRARVSSRQELDRAQRARDEAVALVAERTARVVQTQKRLADLTLRSWGGGMVDELPFEVGERTSAGSVVAVVLADQAPYVRVWLPARVASKVELGNRARVEVEGIDGALAGVVEKIARESDFTPHFALTERESAHLVYETRIRLQDAPRGLRPGLPARVEVTASASPHGASSPAPAPGAADSPEPAPAAEDPPVARTTPDGAADRAEAE